MPKKTLYPPLYPIADTHVSLLQKADVAETSVKWCSPDALSKKLRPNLFRNGSLKVLNKKGMIGEKVLLDGEDLHIDSVPSKLEDRHYIY